MRRLIVFAGLLLAVAANAAGVPLPQDRPYPGTIELRVDASDVERRVYHVEQKVPVSGALTLLYPQWLPGNHGPRGLADQIANLSIRAGDRALAWRRDPLDVYALHVDVPSGVRSVDVSFDVITPHATNDGRQVRVVVTGRIIGLQWNQVVLYPAGYYARRIPVAAQIKLPAEWQFASSLIARGSNAGWTTFAPASLEELVDSPLWAGAHVAKIDLTPPGAPPIRLNAFAEAQGDLAVGADALAAYRGLVREAAAALGSPRYDRYEFLLALSDTFGGIGLEHIRSSENSLSPGHFRAWDEDVGSRDLLAHEFTHSWNGKTRRPARMWTPQYNVPMQDDLLWVYEGMTQYYGLILAARSGLWKPEFARDELGETAAVFDRRRPGRDWRSLEDTTHQPIMSPRRPLPTASIQRGEDYYSESVLLWLDVDQRLRELTKGAKGLDDFARVFFAAKPDQGQISTYEFRDVVRGLNAIAPFDWDALLRERVQGTKQPVLDGLTRAGWQLVYREQPSDAHKDSEKGRRVTDLGYSLGLTANRDGVLTEVVWGGPAFKAGLTPQTTIAAVDGRTFTGDLLKEAVTRAKGGVPIELLVKSQDRWRTVRIDYRDGLRYPRLERIEGREDGLAKLLAPLAAQP
ncbi:MAG: hypothetical protein ABW136_07310 [Steroidobacteraceae bacterium]